MNELRLGLHAWIHALNNRVEKMGAEDKVT